MSTHAGSDTILKIGKSNGETIHYLLSSIIPG